MRILREGNTAASRACACIGIGLAAAMMAQASAVVVTYRPDGSNVVVGEQNVAKTGGTFDKNAAVKVLVVGSKTLDIERGEFREPVAVKTFAKSGGAAAAYQTVTDAELASPGSAFQFALASDVVAPPGTTALDAVSSPDFGRMMQPEGEKATRMRVFTPVPEADDNELGDDEGPELMVMSAVPGTPITITPILGGAPDAKDPGDPGYDAEDPSNLVFGTPTVISPSVIARGSTPISMVLGASPAPQRICVIGLDMSGDMGVLPGQRVVGYQLDIPQGSSFPVKLVPVGNQELSPMMAAEDGMVQEVGDVSLMSVESPALPGPSLDVPPIAQTPEPNTEPFTPGPDGFPPTPPIPPVTPVPAPGVATLLASALALMRRRRAA